MPNRQRYPWGFPAVKMLFHFSEHAASHKGRCVTGTRTNAVVGRAPIGSFDAARPDVCAGSRSVGWSSHVAGGRPLLWQAGHEVLTPSLTGIGERAHLTGPHVDLSVHVEDVQRGAL